MDENRLDVDLAMEVAHFFQVSSHDAQTYLKIIEEAIQTWEHVADTIGIPKAEQKRISPAFRSRFV